MSDSDHSAYPARAAVDSFPPECDKENAITIFGTEEHPRKHRAWDREKRPASKQKGKNRIIWKRHETRACGKGLTEALPITSSSPQKVVKKVCVTKDGAAQTPRHKRLGVAATWDRRQSDRLHKNHSIRISSPIKVHRDPVIEDITSTKSTKSGDKLNTSRKGTLKDAKTSDAATPEVVTPLDTREIDAQPEGKPNGSPTATTVTENLTSLVAKHQVFENSIKARFDEGSGFEESVIEDPMEAFELSTLGRDSTGEFQQTDRDTSTPEDLQTSQRPESAPRSPPSATTARVTQAQIVREQNNSPLLWMTGSMGDLSAETNEEELSDALGFTGAKVPAQDALPDNETEIEQRCFGTLPPTPSQVQGAGNSYEESIRGDQLIPLSSQFEAIEEASVPELLQEQLGEDVLFDDDTCMEVQAPDDIESDDELSETRIGSPGRTGPVETLPSDTHPDSHDFDADDSSTDENPSASMADNDPFANMDDAIAKVNAQNNSNTPTQSTSTLQWQLSEEEYTEQVTELVEETTTVSIQLNDNDDTEMLRDFLNRSRASKAARIAKRSSLNNKRDSDAVKLALASPHKIVDEETDGNSESPFKQSDRIVIPSCQQKTTDDTTQELGPVDELSSSSPPPTSRRSTRNKETKATPSSITIRRPDGSEPFLLKKSEAQELSLATRSNTRRNKGGAISAKLMLMRLKGLIPEAMPEGDRETSIKWNEQLVRYFDESAHEQKLKERSHEDKEVIEAAAKPRVRRKRALGAVNGTPAKATDSVEGVIGPNNTSKSLSADDVRTSESESQDVQRQTQIQFDKEGALPATRRRRGIPTPTSRVPKTSSQDRSENQPQMQTQASRPDLDPPIIRSERLTTAQSTGINTFGHGSADIHGNSGSVTGPATTSSSRNTSSSVTTSAIASAAASVGKRGLTGGLVGARPRGKEARETRSKEKA